MLSEYFVDVCITLCCSEIPNSIRNQKEVFENIKDIVDWYRKEVQEDQRPIEFRDKLDILFWLADYRKNKPFDMQIMLAKLSDWKLGSFVKILEERNCKITEEKFQEISSMIMSRKKLCNVINCKTEMQQLLSDIDSCSLTDDEEVIEKWEQQLSKAHDDLLKVRKIEENDAIASLDLSGDSYENIFSTMMSSVEESQILKTGFRYLQDILVTGGFENRRLYLIGGSSGVGKSAMLINLICNAVKENKANLADRCNTYLYITAENLIDETWIRFYCCLTGTPHKTFMDSLKTIKRHVSNWKNEDGLSDEEIKYKLTQQYDFFKNQVLDILKSHKSNIIFKYVPSGVSTTKDILSMVDSVSRENNLRAVFIDYLDLFSSGKQLELRFELAHVAQAMKNIAIDYNIPVITATQLNREGYTEGEAKLTHMGESMEKVNKSDFVLFLQDANPKTYDDNGITYKHIRMTVLKQRNGKTGDCIKVSMPSMRGLHSIFNFRIEERSNPTIVQEQKETKQLKSSRLDQGDTEPFVDKSINGFFNN